VYSSNGASRSFGSAWVALTLALGVHVADEAANDFLSVYNPAVTETHERVSWLWLPTFTFPVWLTGLTVAVLVLLALSPLAFAGRRWLRRLSFPFAVLMFGNGLLHLAGSLWMGRLMPGVLSSPLLVFAAGWLFFSARRGRLPHGPKPSVCRQSP
jgi:hypothetical protein